MAVGLAALSLTSLMLTLAPQDAGVLSFTRITINNGPGDQYDPHVDDDVSAYSDADPSQIRFYRFSSATDQVLPNVAPDGSSTVDLLSDVSAGRIVFTRVMADRNAIMLYDVASASLSEVAPSPGSNRQGVALGAQTVSFADFGLEQNGEIVAVDLASGASTRLTTNADIDRAPSVSADGTVIAWEHCVGAACSIWQAVHGATGWQVSAPTAPGENNLNPDATETAIVYESVRTSSATGPDLFIVPVGGGPEQQLAIAGEEYNASMRGDVIAFEHRDPTATAADLFVYQRSTTRLFQITNTPTISESLNDVTILADGSIRIVWEARDDGTTRNIYGATFSLPAAPPPPPPPPACLNRAVTLTASRTYTPNRWFGDAQAFSPAMNFALPATLAVTAGNAGNQWATLTIDNGHARLECFYRGGANREHPRTAADVARGLSYQFFACASLRVWLQPGSIVAADEVSLRVQQGDRASGRTTVVLPLTETCNASQWPRARHCTGHGGRGHDAHGDDNDENDDD